MRARILEVEARTTKLLEGLSPEELARPRSIDSEGVKGAWSLEEIILEVVGEAAHHRGEVMTMLWRMDKEPPYVGHLDWLREAQSPA